MKTTGIVALSLLSVAAALPHRQHQHKAKRDLVWITETAEVVETVVQTTTVWVDPSETPASTAPATTEAAAEYTPAPAPTTTAEPSSSSSVYTPPAPPTTTETPTPSSTYVAPTSTYVPPSSTYVAPTSTYVAPTSTYVPPAEPETSTSSAVIAAETSTGGSSAPSGDEFSPSRVTYYSPSVGASSCGPTWSDDSNVVALASGNMNSDLCNKPITLEYNGKTFSAFIGETCPGCPSDHSLDITPTMFTNIMGSTDAGVIHGLKWWFDDN